MKLSIRNFRGIKEGEIDFKNLNILIGGNNSGKTTVLESLFLIPNPFRYVPYGINVEAVSILSSLHSTLGEAYAFLLHEYTSNTATITCSNVTVEFQRTENSIRVYIKTGKKHHVGSLDLSGSIEKIHGLPRDVESYIAKEIGETFYFHPSLMKSIWEYFRHHWVELRGIGLPAKVAKRISEGISAVSYTHLTLPTNREV